MSTQRETPVEPPTRFLYSTQDIEALGRDYEEAARARTQRLSELRWAEGRQRPLAVLANDPDPRFRPVPGLVAAVIENGEDGGLDRPIVPLLNALTVIGIPTTKSCAGHRPLDPRIGDFPIDSRCHVGASSDNARTLAAFRLLMLQLPGSSLRISSGGTWATAELQWGTTARRTTAASFARGDASLLKAAEAMTSAGADLPSAALRSEEQRLSENVSQMAAGRFRVDCVWHERKQVRSVWVGVRAPVDLKENLRAWREVAHQTFVGGSLAKLTDQVREFVAATMSTP